MTQARNWTKIKICGLTAAATLEAALEAGADMVGLVFFARSPRHIALDAARELAALARNRAEIVALTVNAGDEEIAAILDAAQPDWLQLHGGESPERVAALKARFGVKIMKAVGVSTRDDLLAAAAHQKIADRLLFDAKPPPQAALPGGNGLPFDWTLLSPPPPGDWMLSGGLTPDNVARAIELTAAPGVDVSSGVETAPGVKSVEKIRDFIAAARRA